MRALVAILMLLPVIGFAVGLGPTSPSVHAVAGFNPTQVPNLALWLDASRLCLPSGTNVDIWQDFSQRSSWGTNTVASKRPILSNINGRSSVYFDGTNDFMSITNFKLSTEVVTFMALKQNDPVPVGSLNKVVYTNATSITIFESGNALPYPSSLTNIHVPGVIKSISVTLHEWSHNFPDDVDIYLSGPANSTGFKSTMLVSDAGGSDNITNIVFTISSLATNLPENSTTLLSGSYAPSNYETNSDGFATTNATFDPFIGTAANGTWGLYVKDDSGGDGGRITNGWSLTIDYEKVERMLIEHGINSNFTNGFYFQGSKNCAWNVKRDAAVHGSCSSNNAVEETWVDFVPAVVSFTYTNNGVVKKNGEIVSGLTTNGAPPSNNAMTNTLHIGSRNGTELFFEGQIGEVVVYSQKITDVEERDLTRYLGKKYGIVVP